MNKKVKYTVFLAGLAVIGGGTYVVTDHLAESGAETTISDAAKQPPAVGPAESSAAATTKAPDAGDKAGPAAASAAPAPTLSLDGDAFHRLNAAKEAGKNDIKTQRAIPQPAVTAPLQRWEEGSVRKKGKMLRVVWAKQDLTGYRELAWVSGEGERVGSSKCSQKIKMSNEQEPRIRPTMVICWRLSPEKSVYSIMVDLKKKPSKQESVARIDKTWAQMS